MTATTLSRPLFATIARAIAGAWSDFRRSRNRRRALLDLMALDAHRLDDLGISIADVTEALGRPQPSPTLHRHGADRADARLGTGVVRPA